MATITTDLICNLNQPVAATFLHGNLFSQDNAGNTINVHVMDNGEPATIGGTVSANVIRADGNTVAVSGAISGNKAYVILPQAAYAVPGRVEIIIKLTQNTTITTIAAIVANVYRSTTDTVIDPGTIIPSIQTLIAEIEDAVDSIPVDYSGLLATIAADYSSSKTYQVGQYAWQGGVLKRCIVPITTAETYTAAHWTNAVLGDDVSALKSAISGYIPDAVQASAGFMMATFVPGYETTPDVGSVSSHSDSANYISAKVPATTTDYVEFCGEGGTSTQRYYAVLDADSKVLYRSAGGQSGVKTPNMSNYPTAAYVVVNVKKSYTGKTYLFVGKSVLARLAEKQDVLTFDNDPKAGSANPVKSSGVFNAEKKIVSNFGCLFSNFIQKNVSSTNGKISSTGAENTITHSMLIPIEKVFAATSDDQNISLYLYNSDGEYLGTTAGSPQSFVGDSFLASALTTYPTAKYVRIRFGNSTKPVTTLNYLSKGVSLLLTEDFDSSKGNVIFDTIAKYGEDGVFTPDGESDLDFTITVPFNGDTRNQIYTCIAKYEQAEGVTAVPTIIFRYGNTLNRTTEYILANKGDYETKQWRVIRYPGVTTALSILFHIPVGVTVTIKDFFNTYTDEIRRTPYGIRFNGHQKYLPSLMNPDTLPGVMMAVKCGACAMIQIPKRLSDGTWIFYHDDSLVYNDTYIRQADGTELPSTYNGTLWSAIDFETANSWDWGISKNAMFTGTKPMTMEQFFNICGKTGIMPMLSIHPWPSSAELGEIKAIARKCGVLNRLGIKCPVSHIAEAYDAFGNDIESYTVDVSSGTQTASVVNAAISAMDGLSGCTVRRVIELFANTAYNAYFGESTYDPFKLIADAGYGCSLAMQTGTYHPTLPNSNNAILKGTDIEYWQNKGVSEYTYEYDWSNGLNW